MEKMELEKVFECLVMKVREDVIGWICNRYKVLSWEDGEDIFQEGSYEMWKKMVCEEDVLKEMDFRRLMYGICKNLVGHYLSKKNPEERWDDNLVILDEEEDELLWRKRERLDEILGRMNERDRSLIHHYYMDDWSLKEIAEEMKYKNDMVVKNKKCRIMKRLRKAYLEAEVRGEFYVEDDSSTIYYKEVA